MLDQASASPSPSHFITQEDEGSAVEDWRVEWRGVSKVDWVLRGKWFQGHFRGFSHVDEALSSLSLKHARTNVDPLQLTLLTSLCRLSHSIRHLFLVFIDFQRNAIPCEVLDPLWGCCISPTPAQTRK